MWFSSIFWEYWSTTYEIHFVYDDNQRCMSLSKNLTFHTYIKNVYLYKKNPTFHTYTKYMQNRHHLVWDKNKYDFITNHLIIYKPLPSHHLGWDETENDLIFDQITMNLGRYHTHYNGSGSWVGYIPKCKAKLGYHLILGPLFQQHSHPGPYHALKFRLSPSSEQGIMEVLCANTSP